MAGGYADVWYQSSDGLRLYARDYPFDTQSPEDKSSENKSPENKSPENSRPRDHLTLLCMHGLTRNSADFEDMCEHLRGTCRLVVPDQRGRGRSEYDSDSSRYRPDVYAADMFTLIDHLQLQNPVLVGTSMGGIMAMLMNAMRPAFFRGMVLNDIGPEIDPEGLDRIKSYVGNDSGVTNWQQAVLEAKRLNEVAFPDYSDAQWLRFARRIYEESPDGRFKRLYDPAIAQPIASDRTAAVPDLWPLFAAVTALPLLVIRGETSDMLARGCVEKMRAAHPHLQYAEVMGVGHAPMLDEPEALEALKNYLQQFAM